MSHAHRRLIRRHIKSARFMRRIMRRLDDPTPVEWPKDPPYIDYQPIPGWPLVRITPKVPCPKIDAFTRSLDALLNRSELRGKLEEEMDKAIHRDGPGGFSFVGLSGLDPDYMRTEWRT